MKDGILKIARCEQLVEQYSELLKNEVDIKDKVGRELVDRLLPENITECSQMREIALGLVGKDTTPELLLERLREELTHPEIPEERSEISIMSLHKAKGLEADLVIISSCIDGLIPRIDEEKTAQEQQQELEENRRLFYVGITQV